MPYIGRAATNTGNVRYLDNIASGFDGSDTTFTAQVGGVSITPDQENVRIYLDGVFQHPGSGNAYTISGSTITFTEAPVANTVFSAYVVGAGSYLDDKAVSSAKLDDDAVTAAKLDDDGTGFQVGDLGVGGSLTSGDKLTVTGRARVSGGIIGDLTGDVTGDVTGNTSGTAATVTGGTQASITSAANLATVGTIGTGVWQGTAIASAYLDADTAHLSGTQTFSGAKTFSSGVQLNSDVTLKTLAKLYGAEGNGNASNRYIYYNVDYDSGTDATAGYIKFSKEDNAKRRGQIEFGVGDDGAPATALTIDKGKNATFAGNISFTSGNNITSGNMKMYIDVDAHSTSASYATFEALSDRGIDIRSQSQTRFYTDNANTLALTLDASQNTTIAGGLGLRGTSPNSTMALNVEYSTTNYIMKIQNDHATDGHGVLINAGDDGNVDSLLVQNYNASSSLFRVKGSGRTTTTASTDIVAEFSSTNATGPYLKLSNSGTAMGYIGSAKALRSGSNDNNELVIRAEDNLMLSAEGSHELTLLTNGAIRTKYDSAGNVYHGYSNGFTSMTNPNATYTQFSVGAWGILHRNAYDVYQLSNCYYNSSNQWIAKFNYSGGIGLMGTYGGKLVWEAHDGSVTAGSDYGLTTRFAVTKDGQACVGGGTLNGVHLTVNGDSGSARVVPQTDDAGYLGESNHRWQAVYATNGSIQTSDKNLKTSIASTDLGLDFVNKLNPVSYKWKVGGYDIKEGVGKTDMETGDFEEVGREEKPVAGKRKHYGLIAQEVKEVLGDNDFGGWVKEDLEDDDSLESLRYDQFIAPLIKAVQELSAKVKALENA